jgi:micrococcal nuclease
MTAQRISWVWIVVISVIALGLGIFEGTNLSHSYLKPNTSPEVTEPVVEGVPLAEMEQGNGLVFYHVSGDDIEVIDGDTIKVKNLNHPKTNTSKPLRIRLFGIDAPELSQPHGIESKEWLIKELKSQDITIQMLEDLDYYGRVVAKIFTDTSYINVSSVIDGKSWVFSKYIPNEEERTNYEDYQQQAKENKIGLWADENPVEPWVFRKNK